MKIEKRSGSDEKRILTGMIVDRAVLGRIAHSWTKEGLFKSKWANTVGGWCIAYFNKYDDAPKKSIEGIFDVWAKNKDKETAALVERFLSTLSEQYEDLSKEINSDYIIDLAGEYFHKVAIRNLADNLNAYIDTGEVSKAQKTIDKFGKIEVGVGSGIDVLRDKSAIRKAFEANREPLITYPGDLGKFFEDALCRDSLISFMAPEKRGKTFWLLDISWRGMLQHRKVAFFAIGDLSQDQMMRRFQIRAARRPEKPKTIKYPLSISIDKEDPFAVVDFEERVFKDRLSWKEGYKACASVLKKTRTDDTLLQLSCHPSSTLSVAGLEGILRSWERGGKPWIPDVIVIDYADLLAPPAGIALETREAVNATWKAMRALSQKRHCLVVTATQADAASYNATTIGASNFSEDKRKLAHVNGLIGINQTHEEKESGIQRLNWVVLRESEFNTQRCIHVAGCLGIANPAIRSTF